MVLVMENQWHYTSVISTVVNGNDVDVVYNTNYFKNIIYRLYVRYNGVFKLLDTVKLTKTTLNLTLTSNGIYKVIGYSVDGNKLLSHTSNTFEITSNSAEYTEQVTYFDWE
jgi:hypothetical protein